MLHMLYIENRNKEMGMTRNREDAYVPDVASPFRANGTSRSTYSSSTVDSGSFIVTNAKKVYQT